MLECTPATKTLVLEIERLIASSGRSWRAIERELGWGHGTVGNLIHHRTELRFYHLEALAAALQLRTIDLLARAYGPPQTVPELPMDKFKRMLQSALREVLAETSCSSAS